MTMLLNVEDNAHFFSANILTERYRPECVIFRIYVRSVVLVNFEHGVNLTAGSVLSV